MQVFVAIACGQTIQSPLNEYTLVKELGSGAFGKVFEATTPTGENFAIKWYTRVGSFGWYLDRLADKNREFTLGRILDHPHIIKSVESFDDFTVLEFVPGNTLSSYSFGSLELSESIQAAKQFISGIRHAFIQEYLHLDLHGSNVMLNKSRDVKIIDLSSFFSFQEIRDHYQSSEKSNPKIKQFAIRHQVYSSKIKTPISQYIVDNFDDVAELCIRILMRAQLTREERLHIKAELKTIAWTCDLDHQEGAAIQFESYLDEVVYYLESLCP